MASFHSTQFFILHIIQHDEKIITLLFLFLTSVCANAVSEADKVLLDYYRAVAQWTLAVRNHSTTSVVLALWLLYSGAYMHWISATPLS